MGHRDTDRSPAALARLARLVWRRRWLFVGAMLLVVGSAAFFTLRQEPRHEASADVLLSRQNLAASLAGIEDRSVAGSDVERFTQTQSDVARAPVVARRVVGAVGGGRLDAGEFLRSSEVLTKRNSDVLEFRARDGDRELAARLATEYARQFTRYRRELDTTALRRASAEVRDRIGALRRSNRPQRALERALIEKQEQLETLEALQTSNAFVIRPAAAARQVQPSPVRNGVLALLFGVLLGLGLAWARDSLDTRVRSIGEIEAVVGVPLLARIPPPTKRGGLTMIADPRSAHAEAFRKLRMGLEFAQLDRPTREILVTSAVAGEGKSTTAANVAVALAMAGRRVVCVDLDLRRPALSDLFAIRSQPGVTNVALGHVPLERALVEVGMPRASLDGAAERGSLRVLPAGPLPPDPGEFVGTHALGCMLDELREQADLLVLDAAPLLEVGDAMTLTARGSGLLLVARPELLRRGMLPELRRLIDSSPAVKLGVAITGVEARRADYGYGYGSGAPAVPPPVAGETVR